MDGAADLHHLLAGRAEFIDAPFGLQWEMMFFNDPLGALQQVAPFYPAQREPRFASQKHIFRNR